MFQKEYGNLWFALANTSYGWMPAKASKDPAVCWYTYAGKEFAVTGDFVYLCSEKQE